MEVSVDIMHNNTSFSIMMKWFVKWKGFKNDFIQEHYMISQMLLPSVSKSEKNNSKFIN